MKSFINQILLEGLKTLKLQQFPSLFLTELHLHDGHKLRAANLFNLYDDP